MTRRRTSITALDLFAGVGWGVACQQLGIVEHGVENNADVRTTRDAAGMHNAYSDVWDGIRDPWIVPPHDLLIASPPCQTFSVAGTGAGRRALDEVINLIESGAHTRPDTMRAEATMRGFDDRTALVLSPLAYIWQYRPRYVALEQVPTVLPAWNAIAEVLRRDLGYSVDVGNVQAEQYGVPQTRKRSILVARADGEARLPTPTHSRYHTRSPERLDEGVLPWVSMAEALSGHEQREPWKWAHTPSTTIAGDPRITAREHHHHGEQNSTSYRLTPAEAATLQTFPEWVHHRPAPTVVGTRRSEGGMLIGRQLDDNSRRDVGGHQTSVGIRSGQLPGVRVSGEQGAALQAFPRMFPFQGTKSAQFLQIGNAVPPRLARAILESLIK